MKLGITVVRAALVAVMAMCLWTVVQARAVSVESLMVPSAAMGRDIPVAFMAGGPARGVPSRRLRCRTPT